MTPERLRAIERLFHEAREREPGERSQFLAVACAQDPALRQEVESLLSQPQTGQIDAPVGALIAELVAPIEPLAPGSSVGPYVIEKLLGVGGMGEVYRARDTTLGRDVAIKILPRHFTSNAERLSRFEREARVLASLNHPHIAAIYGVVDADGLRGLVLELVEGPTLDDRLKTGPLSVREALRVAHQIGEALEAAHEKGIVHRDLKPANIKITPEGVVKVLDFGLAKAVGAEATGAHIPESPSITSDGTTPGVILGTAAYMSPEQARGEPIDKRADIWAFGCVFYEMLAGRKPFAGGTASEAIARILEREPDWAALPPQVPTTIRRLVQRCLKKERSARLHDIADARLEIAEAMSASDESAGPAEATSTTNRWRWIASAAIAGLLVAGIFLVAEWWTRAPGSIGRLEFRIDLSDNAAFGIAVSPDGRRVAFGVCCGGPQIWVHSFDSGETRPVPETEGGTVPFWSPDSAEIGFFARRQLLRVRMAGGPPVVICEAGAYSAGTWNANGDILFAAERIIFRVSASGGARSRVELTDGEAAAAMRTTPVFLSDGRHFIYHLEGAHGAEVRVGSLDSTVTRHLVDSDRPATFAPPSHLLFQRGTALMTATIDPTTFDLKGPESTVALDAAPGYLGGPGGLSLFSASANVLALVPTRGGAVGRLIWFDRVGKVTGAIEVPPGVEYLNPAISPDGERIAVNRMDPQTGNWDVWVVDAVGRVSSRLTSDPARDSDPVWSPDGQEIAFASNRGGKSGLYRKPADGSGSEVPIVTLDSPAVDLVPNDWSDDGRYVLYTIEVPKLGLSLWKAPVSGSDKPLQLVSGAFGVFGARLSPDGQWIAYTSFETGPPELYVQRLVGGDKRQISHGGGTHPRWTAGGRELVYWAFPGGVLGVDFETSAPQLRIGPVKTLIATPILTLIDSRPHYDVSRDGRRFLLRQAASRKPPAITVMVNWADNKK